MKNFILCFSLLCSSLAFADDLGDANRLFESRHFNEAFTLYSKLANGGNSDAQFHLGEMYWYGDGIAVNSEQAAAWLQKAASSGNVKASALLEIIRQRQVRRSDIEYWMTKYDGKELISGKFNCSAPDIPVLSKTNKEIKNVNQLINEWHSCYNNFVENVNNALPPEKRIPADISRLMTEQEYESAKAHLGALYTKITADAKVSADLILANRDTWLENTQKYVEDKNNEIKSKQALYDILQHQRENNPQFEVRDRLNPSGNTPTR